MKTVSFVIESIAQEFVACLPCDLYEVQVEREAGIIRVKYWRI